MTTLAEYKYLGNDQETRMGVAKTLVKESPWLRDLPFAELANNNISRYKMEVSDGGATTHAVDDTWNVVNPEWEYREAPLAIIGDNISVDNFGEFASGPENAMAVAIELKTKGVGQTFDKLAVYGRTTSTASLANSNNFKGLLRLIAEAESSTATDLDGWAYTGNDSDAHNKQVVTGAASATIALTLTMLDALRDAVRPKPTHFVMSRLMRRKVNTLVKAAGNDLRYEKDGIGGVTTFFGEQTLLIDDQIKDNLNLASSNVLAIASYDYDQAISASDKDMSPIFAVRMAEDGLCGINGVGMIQVVDLGELEGKDAKGKRIKFYCGMRLTNKRAAAVLLNVNSAG
uniref:Putative capsid protein n=1 Tax=viral metagenome TaxID=1070528 RepID=A0A6M3KUK6_9ZZZZ